MNQCLKKKVLWPVVKSLQNTNKYGSALTSNYGHDTFQGNRLKDFRKSYLSIPTLSSTNLYPGDESLTVKRYKSLSANVEPSVINSYNGPAANSWCSFGDFSRRYLQTVDESTSDLKRFLSEVGTDPREARFWLKHFRTVERKKPFAILQIDPELFNNPEKLESLTSSLSFLHRNNMKPVIVCGSYLPSNKSLNQQEFQKLKSKTTLDMTVFTSLLEAQGVKARPLFVGCGLVQCEDNQSNHHTSSNISSINVDLIQWCLHTKHIPVVSALGETPSGQVVPLDLWSLTGELSKLLEPLKVMKINLTGGLTNENNQVIPNVNLPIDLSSFDQKPWFSKEIKTKAHNIYNLLQCMPSESSVVITSVESILQELFTHKGSGTFFKITEPINKYTSYGDIDIERLKELFNKSFQKELKDDYLDAIKPKIDKIYLSQKYNAAAIILRDETNIPYLCKIGVSAKAQGEGTGEMLWDAVRSDYKQLYWRSRIDNVINSWYFKKSEGSWSNGNWTVFWYGVIDPSLSTKLINEALQKEESFIMPSKKVSTS